MPAWETMKTVCPLQCRLRHSAESDNPPADEEVPDQVEWAGFPVNLDWAFSGKQRDKVLMQHLKRQRKAQLWRPLNYDTRVCACQIAARAASLDPDVVKAYVTSLRL